VSSTYAPRPHATRTPAAAPAPCQLTRTADYLSLPPPSRCLRHAAGAQFYYGFITYLTIGYGDVTPKTKGGKALGTLLVTMGLFSFTALLAELADIQAQARLGAEKTLRQRLAELHEVIAQDNDGKVTAEEYILFNLKKMGKVEDETLALLRDQFKALDADGSGELDADDIEMLSLAAAKIAQENLQT
jgi:hypothetical protein